MFCCTEGEPSLPAQMKISAPRDTAISIRLVPSPRGTQSPGISTQTFQPAQEELEHPQMQITKAMGLVESTATS